MTSATNKMTEEEEVITGEVMVTKRRSPHTRMEPFEELALMRELAAGDVTQSVLGKKYGITQQAISAFAKRHARQIDEIRTDLSDQFAGLPLVRKANRIAAYIREVEMLNSHPHASHHEWAKARMIAYRNVAEELGDLPQRQGVTVIPVVHMIEGVNVDDL